ncbi:MAG: DUF2723 domain-containing protein [Bacteroidota bacterium]
MKSFGENKYRDHVIAFSLWLAVFIIYLQTIATTVGFIDSGELATVPYILGIAHPTGYPLWTLVTHIFSLLPIAKEEIVRLNIFSALVTSSAAAIFFYAMLLLLRSGEKQQEPYQSIIPALFSALALAFSQTFWDQSTSIEVYAFHLFLLSSTLLFFLRAIFSFIEERVIDRHKWLLFGFTLGLSFTNHLTTILLAPGFLFLYFSVFRLSKEGIREIVILAAPFILGLSVYVYFPLRAVQQPILNWGYPATLERIFWHVSGKQFQVWMFSSSAAAAKQWNHFLNAAPVEFYYAPLLFSLLGAWRLLTRDRRIFIFIFLLLAGCIAYTVNYDIKDIDSYFLLAYVSLAMFAGFGALEVIMMVKKNWGGITISVILCAVVIAELSANWSEADESKDFLVQDYTATLLANLKPNAVILSYQWDYFVSASYYFQYVKHIRTDVTVIDKELLRRSWYYLQMKKNHPAVYEKSKKEIDGFLEELYKFEHDLPYDPAVIEARYNRMIDSFIDYSIDSVAVYVTGEIEPHLGSHYLRVPEGLAFRLYKDSTYHSLDFPIIFYRPYDKNDLYSRQIHTMYTSMLVQRALYEESFGKTDLALRYAKKAFEIEQNPLTIQLLRRFSALPQ